MASLKMAISIAGWGVYGKIRQNVDHLSKKIIHYCISLKVMAKTELWPIFLCIFSNFLCIYKRLVHIGDNGGKLKIIFLIA